MKHTPKEVGLLVQRALCLEAVADKNGCTTRYHDLPGLPLEEFIVAGINVGPAFERFAEDWQRPGETRLFHHFVSALEESNRHKSGKFVNFGLLEILFPTVAARLTCDDPGRVVPHIVELMQSAPASDVQQMVRARELAFDTSRKREAKLADLTSAVRSASSPYACYQAMLTPTTDTAARQWIENYQAGLPLLAEQFEAMQSSNKPILERIKDAYEPVRAANPDTRIGILADMSAAAIFLYLSYNE